MEKKINLKIDLVLSLAVGEIMSWLLIILSKNLFPNSLYQQYQWFIFSLPVYFPLVCAFCLLCAYLINKKLTFIYQVAKFILIGGLNTLMDYSILTLCIILFRNYYKINPEDVLFYVYSWSVFYYMLYKAISFVVALINSFFWNKYWAFARKSDEKTTSEFTQFIIVNLGGFLINVSIASGVFKFVKPLGQITQDQWAILAAVVATVFSMVWNFIGFKYIVFEDKVRPLNA